MEEFQVWGILILFIILPLNKIGNTGKGYDLARKDNYLVLYLLNYKNLEILALKMRRNPFLEKSEKESKMKKGLVTN